MKKSTEPAPFAHKKEPIKYQVFDHGQLVFENESHAVCNSYIMRNRLIGRPKPVYK